MESSPLTLAHDHARAASLATQGSDTTVAVNEHALAAGEFAKAASGTGSAEALRALKLLEAHHQRLSELLRFPTERPVPISSTEPEVQSTTEKPISTSAAVAELRASKTEAGPRSPSPLRNPPSLNPPRRIPPRDLSSSIASNLASARGIRSNNTRQPLSPSVSTLQAPGNLDIPRKDGKRSKVPSTIPEGSVSKPSWVPPRQPSHNKSIAQTATSRTSAVAEQPTQPVATNDEGFSKFYNAFENILYKLSAPLAFAGLPLTTEESPGAPSAPDSAPSSRRTKSTSKERLDSEPDLTKYISRAALRASARDGHSGNDSFYVVPTTGHSLSYAQILSFAEKEKRRLTATIHGENPELFSEPSFEDEFVDARETPMPPSPGFSRQASNRRKGDRETENRVEELYMENMTLKECVDKLSKRLHVFEMSAQKNSMALQESMRFYRPNSPAREPVGAVTASGDEALKRRLLELEELMVTRGKEVERLGRENEKLKIVVGRYREKWEKLKEGARTRRDGGAGKEGVAKEGQGSKESDNAAPERYLAG